MLTTIADAIMRHEHRSYWDAPSHFRARTGRGDAAQLRHERQERLRNMRHVGEW
ncbi:MAG: hypothetical protein AAFU41_10005 [Pseudomonadota bacterium]